MTVNFVAYVPRPAQCSVCGHRIWLNAATNYGDRERIVESHEGACYKRMVAGQQQRTAAQQQQDSLRRRASAAHTALDKEAVMPTQPPVRMLCQSCCTSTAKIVPWTREHWKDTGHAAISSEKWEAAQEDAVSHNYRPDVVADLTGVPRAYARTSPFAKSPGPTGTGSRT